MVRNIGRNLQYIIHIQAGARYRDKVAHTRTHPRTNRHHHCFPLRHIQTVRTLRISPRPGGRPAVVCARDRPLPCEGQFVPTIVENDTLEWASLPPL